MKPKHTQKLGGRVPAINIDIVWHICVIISEESTTKITIDTLRATSQVCTAWRTLLLSSPSIWAKLINIDLFRNQHSHDWICEVLRRTSESPLYIKLSYLDHYSRWTTFVQTLLEDNWHRIRSLNVNYIYLLPVQGMMQTLLQNSSPLLETFEVSVDYQPQNSTGTYFQNSQIHLPAQFGNKTPRLRNLTAPFHDISIAESEWKRFAGLHSLSFKIKFDFSTLFRILSLLPLLKHLSISVAEREIEVGDVPPGGKHSLPILKSFDVSIQAKAGGHWIKYLTLVKNMMLTEDCSLEFSLTSVTAYYPSLTDLERVSNVVCGYLMLSRARTKLSVEHNRGITEIKTSDVHIHLHFYHIVNYSSLFTTIMNTVLESPLQWDRVEDLTLLIKPDLEISGDANLGMLMSIISLTNIKHFRVRNYKFLAYLYLCPIHIQKDLFPALQSIEVDSLKMSDSKSHLHNFLTRRAKIGKPIKTLLLNDIGKPNFRFLNDVTDLQVVWGPARQFTHICRTKSTSMSAPQSIRE